MKQGVSNKPKVSDDLRRRVLDLRRRHSLREVAEATGLPLGTVKTIASRSGEFRDNAAQRALFALPPIKASTDTLPSVPELPPQRAVTGDPEVDALLWLREIIETGQAALIERAMEAAERIKTPRDVLEKRYRDHLTATNPGNLFAALSSFNLGDLEGLAARSVEKHRLRIEGSARFGDSVLADTDADVFCIEALDGVKPGKWGFLDEGEVAERFKARPELLPYTLADCLHELAYWADLYQLRRAACEHSYDGEGTQEGQARERFVFSLLGEIRPRNREEAKAVLRYLIANRRKDDQEADKIIGNMIA
jgi:hypothetical protein